MSLLVRTNGRLTAAHLPVLVAAVRDANLSEPETTAVEWKRWLDLDNAQVRFDLARHLLGFANRAVDVAQRSFAGYAYLLVGVEPGRLEGVSLPDPARLGDALSRFIAPGSPHWELHLACVEERTVAVLEVAPPQHGDRIATLQRTHGEARAGRIFVRRPGKTMEAGPDEVRMLEERFAKPARDAEAQAAERHELERRRTAIEEERAHHERLERAERRAANFVPSRRSAGLALDVAAQQVSGMVLNAGGPATVTGAILHSPLGGAYPGATAAVYGSGPVADAPIRVRIDTNVDLMLRFSHPNLAALRGVAEPLSVVVSFVDDQAFHWEQTLCLRREGADAQGRDLWTLRPDESVRRVEDTPEPGDRD